MFHNRIKYMMDVVSTSGSDSWVNSTITDYICNTGRSIPIDRDDIQISLSASKLSGLFPDQASINLIKVLEINPYIHCNN